MAFIDLDVRFAVNEVIMRELGYARWGSPREVVAEKPGELHKARLDGLVVVRSKNPDVLREATKIGRVRLLYADSFPLDVGLFRFAADKEKTFEIPIAPLLESRGIARAMLLSRMRQFLELCVKYKAQFVLVSQAKNPLQLKSPQEMIALATILGITAEQARFSITEVAGSVME